MGIAFSLAVPRLLRRPHGVLQLPSTTRTPPVRHLPDDLVLDILSRIPVKSLCRFRCVSRGWHALISGTIVAAYRSRGVPLLVVGSDRNQALRLIDMDGNVVKAIRNAGSVWRLICTSCDSLVCVVGVYCDVTVIDLATGEVLQTCVYNQVCGRRLISWGQSGLLGFGRAVPSGVYKLVHINPYNTREILTVGDGAGWRRMQPPPTTKISYASNPVVVNGVLHFMLKSQLDGNISVLCFDLEREEWKEGIKGPADVEELHQRDSDEPALCELNGSLCMVQPEDQSYGVTNNNIWLLTDSRENTWVKVFEVPFDSYRYDRLIALRMLRDGERLVFCSTRKNTDLWSVQIYDPHSWEFTGLPNALAGVHGTNFSPCS